MTPDVRLAEVVSELEGSGISCLVMGGHAVRFYGLSRHTNDVDLHVSPDQWDDLPTRLVRTNLFAGQAVLEGSSWRPGAFRRFQIGTLPDGREEWLEFWRENHLLAPYHELQTKAERGPYGGREITFLGLADLIRSKETERDADWQDVAALEQFLDARLLARLRSGTVSAREALASLRSQTGLLGYLEAGFLTSQNAGAALSWTTNPVSQASPGPVPRRWKPAAGAAIGTRDPDHGRSHPPDESPGPGPERPDRRVPRGGQRRPGPRPAGAVDPQPGSGRPAG